MAPGTRHRLLFLILAVSSLAWGDQVIMKDGTVYKGKILIDTDKAILIGNPPFDPNSYLLEADDIEKIIYEEYKPNPPAERKRGLTFEGRLLGNAYSSDQLKVSPAGGLYGGVGFRVHPALELNGGISWIPSLHSSDGFTVQAGTEPTSPSRTYKDFFQFSPEFSARVYPFYMKPWKTEPYLVAGYSWAHLIPNASGDSLSGSGWHVGFGAIRPLTTHLFLESTFRYQKISYDQVNFLGSSGSLDPTVDQSIYSFSLGVSYRL